MNVDTIVIALVIAVVGLAIGVSVLLASLNYPRHIRHALQSYGYSKLLLALAFMIGAFRANLPAEVFVPLANGLGGASVTLNYVSIRRLQEKHAPRHFAFWVGVLLTAVCFGALQLSQNDLNLVRTITSTLLCGLLLLITVELLVLFRGRGVAHVMSGAILLLNFIALSVRVWMNIRYIGPTDDAALSETVERAVYAVVFITNVIGPVVFLLMASDAFNRELQILANTDGLTGVLARRRFLEVAEIEFVRAKRYGRPLTLLILDIDRFKSINDRAGHPFGDRVIKAVAQCCTTQLRPEDAIGRLGGEEFAVLLPESGQEAGERIAERLRATIEESVGALGAEQGVAVTCSVGGVALSSHHGGLSTLIELADAALYEAKDRGRNRVCFANAPITHSMPVRA